MTFVHDTAQSRTKLRGLITIVVATSFTVCLFLIATAALGEATTRVNRNPIGYGVSRQLIRRLPDLTVDRGRNIENFLMPAPG